MPAPGNAGRRRVNDTSPGREHGVSGLEKIALDLHARGYQVIPCGSQKRPLTTWKNWQTERQTEADVKGMPWSRATNVIAICGVASGDLIVLDWDCKNNEPGLKAHKQFNLEHPGHRPEQTTRSGGIHTLMRGEGRNGYLYLDGERCGDFKGAGGQIVVYDPECFPVVTDLPAMPILNGRVRVDHKPKRQEPTQNQGPLRDNLVASTRYGLVALEREVQDVQGAVLGSRNGALNSAAYNLGQLVGAGALEEGEVQQRLEAAAIAIGLQQGEISATIQSGLTAGKLQPRKIAPRIATRFSTSGAKMPDPLAAHFRKIKRLTRGG
jgi:Bifunctional DNA primase/polymerase, N-terminal